MGRIKCFSTAFTAPSCTSKSVQKGATGLSGRVVLSQPTGWGLQFNPWPLRPGQSVLEQDTLRLRVPTCLGLTIETWSLGEKRPPFFDRVLNQSRRVGIGASCATRQKRPRQSARRRPAPARKRHRPALTKRRRGAHWTESTARWRHRSSYSSIGVQVRSWRGRCVCMFSKPPGCDAPHSNDHQNHKPDF